MLFVDIWFSCILTMCQPPFALSRGPEYTCMKINISASQTFGYPLLIFLFSSPTAKQRAYLSEWMGTWGRTKIINWQGNFIVRWIFPRSSSLPPLSPRSGSFEIFMLLYIFDLVCCWLHAVFTLPSQVSSPWSQPEYRLGCHSALTIRQTLLSGESYSDHLISMERHSTVWSNTRIQKTPRFDDGTIGTRSRRGTSTTAEAIRGESINHWHGNYVA